MWKNADSRQPAHLKPLLRRAAACVGFEISSVVQKHKILSQMGLPKAPLLKAVLFQRCSCPHQRERELQGSSSSIASTRAAVQG